VFCQTHVRDLLAFLDSIDAIVEVQAVVDLPRIKVKLVDDLNFLCRDLGNLTHKRFAELDLAIDRLEMDDCRPLDDTGSSLDVLVCDKSVTFSAELDEREERRGGRRLCVGNRLFSHRG